MKRNNPGARRLIYFLILLMALPSGVLAQDPQADPEAAEFSKEELAQMLAPIALYPDSLLAQILMASTYPLEVVQAARWVADHPDLKTDALDAALKDEDWDVSVKSMTHFPDILKEMNERIEETSRLGDAFLAQEAEMMDTIQELRSKAKSEGHLESTEEQKVVVEETVIIIESSNPEVIYVPTYSPTVVYGAWWYPAYPPYRPYYPYYPGGRAVAFTAGIVVGAAVTSWCRFGWRSRSVNVNINRTTNFNRNVNRGGGNQKWKHNPKHRKGVPYKDRGTSKRYGQSPTRSKDARRDARGYERSGQGKDLSKRDAGKGKAGSMDRERQGGADRGKTGNLDRQKPSTGDRGKTGSMDRKKPSTGGGGKAGAVDRQRAGGGDRGKTGSTNRQKSSGSQKMRSGSGNRGGSGGGSSSAFGGMSSRSSSSRASSRGKTSRRGGGGRR